jgi:hypothetical protein
MLPVTSPASISLFPRYEPPYFQEEAFHPGYLSAGKYL